MDIVMTGIDFNKAPIEVREKYAFSDSKIAQLSASFLSTEGIEGVIFLATCNRTEIYVSSSLSAYEIARLCGVSEYDFDRYFTSRSGMELVTYLMEVACGIHSQIFGEDQILTQLKSALSFARKSSSTDAVLETLFRMAITNGKEVKTTCNLAIYDSSVPAFAISVLKQDLPSLKNKNCLIIGNGQMGLLTARLLIREGANVSMTLRQYKTKEAIIPEGCHVVLYENRYLAMKNADIIVSATKSPHHTIYKDEFEQIYDKTKSYHLIDLAIPRDISSDLSTLKNVTLYDMDHFHLSARDVFNHEHMKKARKLISHAADEYYQWYTFRGLVPAIKDISSQVASLTVAKLTKPLQQLPLNGQELQHLKEDIQDASFKSVSKLLYDIKEIEDTDMQDDIIDALVQSASKL